MKHVKWLICAIFILPLCLSAQNFELEKFKEFQEKHKNLSADGLMELYPAGTFLFKAETDFQSACFSHEVDTVFKLTAYEKSLIEKHGFMVTERWNFKSFGAAYDHIFTKDLPVYVSSDAILHTLHMSYDDILKGLEEDIIIPKLQVSLENMRQNLPTLGQKYAARPEMRRMLLDLDIYLTIPSALLSVNGAAPVFTENKPEIDKLLALIESESPADLQLFASVPRTMDFSQFTPRGHYTQPDKRGGNSLARYFKSMIWLGRTEMMLGAPQNVFPTPTPEDIQRQTVLSVLLTELIEQANTRKSIDEIELIITSLVGEQDNVTLTNLTQLIKETKVSSAADLLDAATLTEFQNVLKTKGAAYQRINSQILMGNSPENIVPPAAFLLFGQRFVIDSYVFSNLVHDKVQYRMLPSSLDVLFAFGNDASAQLLKKDMTTFKEYPLNAAALRYLVDAYDEGFWSQSFYNGWLNSIRTLNPPNEREKLPRFMQTAAWWQKSMNTQLASWAQLRHDNLLYAKQSYSGGIGCSFPESFVEPVPEFYASLGKLADETIEKFKNIEMQSIDASRIKAYFKTLKTTMDTLSVLAQKELAHIPFNDNERGFLRSMIQQNKFAGCGERVFNGWFPNLFYSGEEGLLKDDRVIADVHTAPTDEAGNSVGWVKHVGTGPVNLAIIVTENAEGQPIVFAGAAMSYYENTTGDFKRLTDEEWNATAQADAKSTRPDFVDLYLANKNGEARSSGNVQSLLTSIEEVSSPIADIRLNIYPNPVESSTTISFSVPYALSQNNVIVRVTNLDGSFVKTLSNRNLPEGAYTLQWNLLESRVAPGTYFVELQIGDKRITQKIVMTGK